MRTSFVLTIASGLGLAAAECPAPGSTDSQGRYSCNPAHQYPNGQSCKTIDGCYYLVDASGKPVDNSPATSASSAPAATQTPACAAPGEYDSQGRYSCNPAHQYPNGQSCKDIDGCPLLVDAAGKPIVKTGTTSAQPSATPTSACAAPGEYDDKGRYSCNPAHQYPGGQVCKIIDGCPLLCGSDGKPVIETSVTSAQPTATQTSACAAPGEYDSQGRYSCNPAHQYPNGQVCKIIDGCPLLCGGDGKPIATAPATATPTGQPPVVTAGAAALQGGSALAIAAVALLL